MDELNNDLIKINQLKSNVILIEPGIRRFCKIYIQIYIQNLLLNLY